MLYNTYWVVHLEWSCAVHYVLHVQWSGAEWSGVEWNHAVEYALDGATSSELMHVHYVWDGEEPLTVALDGAELGGSWQAFIFQVALSYVRLDSVCEA